MNFRLVLDTNIVLDWLVFEDPAAEALNDAVLGQRATPCIDEFALGELRCVLARPGLGLDAAHRARTLDRYRVAAEWFPARAAGTPESLQGFPRCRDPDDQPFLLLTCRAKARALVSRDRQVLAMARRMRAYGVEVVDLIQLTPILATEGADRTLLLPG
jgi:predicted nucleic acid-binding protein